jgi:hypothetical protein
VLSRCIVAFGVGGAAITIDNSNCAVLDCCDLYGNQGGDYVGCLAAQLGIDGNISEDPLFCDALAEDLEIDASSPCAPDNSPGGCGLIGALPVGCDASAVVPASAPVPQFLLRVLPNPVADRALFAWGANQNTSSLRIYDANGRLIEELKSIRGRTHWVPARDLPNGVYFARVVAGGSSSVKKFVISR